MVVVVLQTRSQEDCVRPCFNEDFLHNHKFPFCLLIDVTLVKANEIIALYYINRGNLVLALPSIRFS